MAVSAARQGQTAAPAAAARTRAPEKPGITVAGTVARYTPVTDAMLQHPADGEWLMYRRNSGWSYSPLKQITPDNVQDLQLQWAWAMNEGGASQMTPIVHAGIMFLSNTSNTVQALDAKTGELIWENRIGPVADDRLWRHAQPGGVGATRCSIATTDAKLHALDARTGKERVGTGIWPATTTPTPAA